MIPIPTQEELDTALYHIDLNNIEQVRPMIRLLTIKVIRQQVALRAMVEYGEAAITIIEHYLESVSTTAFKKAIADAKEVLT